QWSGGSRLNWLGVPKRCWKWLMPSKLVMSPGAELVTGLGWLIAPTGVESPEPLWLRSKTWAPSPPDAGVSDASTPAVPAGSAAVKAAVPEAEIPRVEPLLPVAAASGRLTVLATKSAWPGSNRIQRGPVRGVPPPT